MDDCAPLGKLHKFFHSTSPQTNKNNKDMYIIGHDVKWN